MGPDSQEDNMEEVKAEQKSEVPQEAQIQVDQNRRLDEQDQRIGSVELSLAEIKSTLEEMKSYLRENSEKIKVLEKAFSLGIIPDRTSGLELSEEHFETRSLKDKVEQPKTKDDESKSHDSGSYTLKLSEAQNNFYGGKYRAAIALYKKLGDEFSEKLTRNNQYYWIGLSYWYLQDYGKSQKYLAMYNDYNPQGNWNGYSKYYQAMCYKMQGRERKSVMMLQDIIQQRQSKSELKEMAQAELKQMEQSI